MALHEELQQLVRGLSKDIGNEDADRLVDWLVPVLEQVLEQGRRDKDAEPWLVSLTPMLIFDSFQKRKPDGLLSAEALTELAERIEQARQAELFESMKYASKRTEPKMDFSRYMQISNEDSHLQKLGEPIGPYQLFHSTPDPKPLPSSINKLPEESKLNYDPPDSFTDRRKSY